MGNCLPAVAMIRRWVQEIWCILCDILSNGCVKATNMCCGCSVLKTNFLNIKFKNMCLIFLSIYKKWILFCIIYLSRLGYLNLFAWWLCDTGCIVVHGLFKAQIHSWRTFFFDYWCPFQSKHVTSCNIFIWQNCQGLGCWQC